MRRTKYDLAGKVVVITGGTSGIGAATAGEMLRRGAQVAVIDIAPDTIDLVTKQHPFAAFGVVADVTDRDQLATAVQDIIDRFGRIDVVVANAGVLARTGTLRNTPPGNVDTLFAVNVIGVMNTVRAVLPQLIENRGQVVLLSSVFAFFNGMGTIPYAMSKAAVEQLGRGLTVELAMHGVGVTTAYFSLIDTPMIQKGFDADRAADDVMKALPRPLLKRLQPSDAANAIVDAVQSRATRVMRPARWLPLSLARGVISPVLDSYLAKNTRLRALLTTLDTR